MFQPQVFHEERLEVMQDLMVAHPFATIVSGTGGRLNADHVPLVLKQVGEFGALEGHIAAGNPLCQETDDAIDVLTIFQGPQTYVTPSWYASKAEHGKVVPTWNYVVVHARGRLRLIRETEWLLRHLEELTQQFESPRQQPWAVSDAPEEFVLRQLRGLVGFEITIEELQGTWKVSQNKERRDWTGVQAGLAQSGLHTDTEMAKLVEERARN